MPGGQSKICFDALEKPATLRLRGWMETAETFYSGRREQVLMQWQIRVEVFLLFFFFALSLDSLLAVYLWFCSCFYCLIMDYDEEGAFVRQL